VGGRGRPDLRSYTGFLLRRAFVRTVGIEASCLGDDTRMRELTVLFVLAEHGAVSQREVARLTHVSPTVMVGLVDSLEARGWLARQRNPQDRRANALVLTAAGRATLDRLAEDLDGSEQRLTADLSAAEVARLRAHLRALLQQDPVLEVGTLADRIGYLIAHAHRVSRELAEQELQPLDLHPRHFGLLAVVGRDEPCSQSHLAAVLGVSDPAILPGLDALEARGLLTRERNAADRRFADVRLTDDGRRVLDQAQKQADSMQAQLVEVLGQKANDDLCELLSRVIGP
jgi:DNA-binding MarR family transcriptional regulator